MTKVMEHNERREARRYRVENLFAFLCENKWFKDPKQCCISSGVAANISNGGMRLQSKTYLPPKSNLRIQLIYSTSGEHVTTVKGRVLGTRSQEEDGLYNVHVQFCENKRKIRRKILPLLDSSEQ